MKKLAIQSSHSGRDGNKLFPGSKLPGYYRKSLRDWIFKIGRGSKADAPEGASVNNLGLKLY
ncbi:MAG TPA: hypothetical protein VHC44_09120 [Verrucomicrobiae bacterium]|nr:hypothetical protein [Verrucomicrobiae bacterium]